MRHKIGVFMLIVAGSLIFYASAHASGSAGASQGISPKSAYTQGKAITFSKLVCSSCPLQKGDLDRDRAMSLKNSLEARNMSEKPGTPDDENIQVLCPGNSASGCESGMDEQELVHYYLTRRYKL
jgi:hypothetical protein